MASFTTVVLTEIGRQVERQRPFACLYLQDLRVTRRIANQQNYRAVGVQEADRVIAGAGERERASPHFDKVRQVLEQVEIVVVAERLRCRVDRYK